MLGKWVSVKVPIGVKRLLEIVVLIEKNRGKKRVSYGSVIAQL